MSETKNRSRFRSAFIVLFWLFVWQGLSIAVGNPILFVGPSAVCRSLVSQAVTVEFWKTIGVSFAKILLGIFSAFLSGVLAGGAAYRSPLFGDFLNPLILLIKSIPVASFVILALIWIGSGNLSVFIGFIVVFPMIYTSTVSGLESTDKKLLEMAKVFQIPLFKKIKYIYRPALIPYLASSLNTAVGMGIKSGVAAEVIGVPDFSIGGQLYMSKIYLDTAGLFAWTFTIIVVTWIFEKVFFALIGRLA